MTTYIEDQERPLIWTGQEAEPVSEREDGKGRPPERIDRIAAKLAQVWRAYPDWRLGQLLFNVNPYADPDPFYVEDTDWEAALDQWIEHWTPTGGG